MAGEEDNDFIFKQHSANVRDAVIAAATGPKVGGYLWKFDESCRVYQRDASGRAHGAPIYKEHFRGQCIEGETPQSWIMHDGSRVNKKRLASAGQRGFSGYRWYTEEAVQAQIWLHENRHKIIQALERCSFDQLKQVAAIVGYKDDAK